MRLRIFYLFAIVTVVINSMGFIVADFEWVRQVSFPQRVVNKQLEEIIPYDGKVKTVFTPHPSELLVRYVSYFYQLYRIKDPLYFTNDPDEFIKLVNKYKPDKNSTFMLELDKKTHVVFDRSNLLRELYGSKGFTAEKLEIISE